MASPVFLIFCFCTCILGQSFDDIFSTSVETPLCVNLLANDNIGSSLNSVQNATKGFTFTNYPSFYAGNNSQSNYTISINAQGVHVLNYGSTNLSSSFLDTGDSWNFTTYRSLPVIVALPDDGNNTGNAAWGTAVGYNIAIYHPGVYYVWIYASSGSNGPNSDSVHFLVRSPLNNTLNFLSSSSPPSSFTDNFVWKGSVNALNVSEAETTWPPSVFNFYLALREDGLMVNQIVLTQSNSSFPGTTYYSPEISCDPLTEIVYFPPKNFTGVDTFTYSVTNGNTTYNSTASVYVGVPAPSPSPSATPSRSPSPTASASFEPELVAPPPGSSKKSQTLAITVATTVVGVGLLFCIIGFVALRSRKKKNKEHNQELVELPPPPTTAYQPIRFFGMDEETTKRTTALLEERRAFKEGGWLIAVKDLKIEYEIGRGASGVVHKGRWQGIDVAVKQLILDHDSLQDSKVVDFFAEAELMMKLKGHPNITQLLGICGDPVCLITEFVDNGSLKRFLVSDQPFDPSLQIRIARDIAAGMLYLHHEGVVHRDLAARNILVDSKMRAKVSDFGMSRVLIDQADGNKTAADVGPIRWMAPEAMRKRVYNKKTDIWSFGVVLYEIMTRKLPYHNTDLIHIATSVSLGELSLIPEIEKEEEKYPPVLVKVLKQCLQKDPDNRPLFEDIIDLFDEHHACTPMTAHTPTAERST